LLHLVPSVPVALNPLRSTPAYDKDSNTRSCRYPFELIERRVCCTVKNAVTNQSLGLITRQVAMTKVCRIASRQARNRVREHKEKVFQERLPAHLSFKPTLESVAVLTKRPTEQPVEVQCFDNGCVARVKSEAERAGDGKREKREQRAARKAREAGKGVVMQRRCEQSQDARGQSPASPFLLTLET
jgi:hypothetical protein